MWSFVFLGPPDYLVMDQRAVYTRKEMRASVKAHGIKLDEDAIETHGTIGMVERYRTPLRLAYERIRADTKNHTTD